MLRAYGERAERRSRLFPSDFPAILCDFGALKEAYLDAVGRRERGEAFFLQTLLPNSEWELCAVASRVAFGEGAGVGRWRAFAEQIASGQLLLNGTPMSQLRTYTASDAATIADLHLLADVTLVASQRELSALTNFIGREPHYVARLPIPDLTIELPNFQTRESLVVWAPSISWTDLGTFVVALRELVYPISIVAAVVPPPSASLPFTWYTQQQASEALRRATALIDATIDGPDAALQLASLNTPLAVSSTSGAKEYLAGAIGYNPTNWRSIQKAASDVLGAPAALPVGTLPDVACAMQVLKATQPNVPPAPPLVSIVIPTYNRREELTKALGYVERQIYPNIECIVVNDGGVAVDDIVARYAKARLINLEKNVGGLAALNVGSRETRGKYFCLLPDDDAFYPDHLARLVEALERTGAAVAHGNGLVRFLSEENEGFRLYGFNAEKLAHHADPVQVFAASPIAFHAQVIRRDLLERIGWFDEAFKAVADLEVQMRLAVHSMFVHVDHVTLEWVVRNTNTFNTGKKHHLGAGAEFSKLYERYPLAEYPSLAEPRRAAIEQSGSLPEDGWFFPPVMRI